MPESGSTLKLPEKAAFLKIARGLEGIDSETALKLARLSFLKSFTKGETIFAPVNPSFHFYLVETGLVKVSIYAPSGFKLTYLLAERGEPLNLVSPLTCNLRSMAAEALTDGRLLCVKQPDFMPFMMEHPALIMNAVSILGKAVDSANLRIIDLIEKRVEDRLARVLYTLYKKFGAILNFTSNELAALTGTTSESTLRALGRLREKGLIQSERGRTIVLDPVELLPKENETLWL